MEKRKQAARTPNASRNTTSRCMSERQSVRGLPNLAAAFGVREACFPFGLSQYDIAVHVGAARGEGGLRASRQRLECAKLASALACPNTTSRCMSERQSVR